MITINILFTILIVCIIAFVLFKLASTVKKEKIAKKYRKCMKKGDDVVIVQLSDKMTGTIVNFDDTYVIVETKIKRNFIYPKT